MKNSILTISYKIRGTIDQEHFNEFFEQMSSIARRDGKINLVLEIHQIDSLRNLNAFFSDEKPQRTALKGLRKFALIADANWIEEFGDFIDLLTPNIEVNVFDFDERDEANTWLQSPTRKEDGDLQERVKQGYAHLV